MVLSCGTLPVLNFSHCNAKSEKNFHMATKNSRPNKRTGENSRVTTFFYSQLTLTALSGTSPTAGYLSAITGAGTVSSYLPASRVRSEAQRGIHSNPSRASHQPAALCGTFIAATVSYHSFCTAVMKLAKLYHRVFFLSTIILLH